MIKTVRQKVLLNQEKKEEINKFNNKNRLKVYDTTIISAYTAPKNGDSNDAHSLPSTLTSLAWKAEENWIAKSETNKKPTRN